jgi:hypothetical protein
MEVGAMGPVGTVERPENEGVAAIRVLDRFAVHVDGKVVPTSNWRSRKARDLLRILVARRGRPVPRGELCELLGRPRRNNEHATGEQNGRGGCRQTDSYLHHTVSHSNRCHY